MKPTALLLLGSVLAGVAADPPNLALTRLGDAPPSTFERIEFRIDGVRAADNPFDPTAIRIDLEIRGPAGAPRLLPAFYYQPFAYESRVQGNRRRGWYHPEGPAEWRARFAAESPGDYEAVAVATDGGGSRRSNPVRFTCRPGSAPGYLRVSRTDPRFFEFGDGTPFFAIGQNLAFVGPDQYLDTARAAEVFAKLGGHGANFARIWVCAEDWALGIEARKSAWGRSWSWAPPFVPMPGRDGYHANALCVRLGGTEPASATLNPTYPIAVRPNHRYHLTGTVMTEPGAALVIELDGIDTDEPLRSEKPGQWTRFERPVATGADQWWLGRLNLRTTGAGQVWLRQLSLQPGKQGPELLGEAAPRLAARGWYNPLDSFMLDQLLDAADQNGIHLQLCLLTRDHYMHDLRDPASPAYQHALDDARHLLRYAVARWGWSPRVLAWEYFNEMDPGAPTERFHQELGEHLARIDPYRHLRTTSGWGPAPKQWTHPQLDIADLHHYMRPNAPPAWQDEVEVVLDRARLLRQHAPARPALLGEFGLADEKWGLSPLMKQDSAGVHFHNTLWASAFSGVSGTAMFWWWETLDQQRAYPHYQPLAQLLKEIPFTRANLQPIVHPLVGTRARLLAWRGADCVYGWILNPDAGWWHTVMEPRTPDPIAGATLTLPDLAPGPYRVEWRDPWTGNTLETQSVHLGDGPLTLSIPAFTRDLACALTRPR